MIGFSREHLTFLSHIWSRQMEEKYTLLKKKWQPYSFVNQHIKSQMNIDIYFERNKKSRLLPKLIQEIWMLENFH